MSQSNSQIPKNFSSIDDVIKRTESIPRRKAALDRARKRMRDEQRKRE